ncbi:MAG TPA: ATP-binding protein, partial [Solirubrobacteraceae bacterium]|nr:ATP-binding protein [Solirubrobacteraceae bacterium]
MRARLASSMSAKLLASQLLVVLAGAGTLLLVALSVGPGIFHHHIHDALGYVPPDVAHHLDTAYNTATLISLGIAVGAAVLMALILSTIVSASVVRPVRALAGAAQRIARGGHASRVPVRGTDELAQLAGAFNDMATSLERAEQIRRQLLADVAHELRNPLATVESYVEALSDGVLAADEENWSAIRAETTRLNRLVNDLQEVSRAEAHELDLHPTPAKLSALAEDAVKAATPTYAAKGVTLDAALSSHSPTVEVDRERLAEVLANLLANALRHTPSGGEVRVSAHTQGRFAEIAIADTGEGIPPEHLDRIFERFYRIDPARSRASGGTGIGLAIVRAIVEAHDGTVTATSEGLGHGATFTIRLPIRPSETP